MKFSQFITEARTAAGEVAAKRGLQHAGHGYYADRQGNICLLYTSPSPRD